MNMQTTLTLPGKVGVCTRSLPGSTLLMMYLVYDSSLYSWPLPLLILLLQLRLRASYQVGTSFFICVSENTIICY